MDTRLLSFYDKLKHRIRRFTEKKKKIPRDSGLRDRSSRTVGIQYILLQNLDIVFIKIWCQDFCHEP